MDFERIYREIAQEHGVCVQKVKYEMQKAITAAWTDENLTEEERACQNEVISAGAIPTPEELMCYIIAKIKK